MPSNPGKDPLGTGVLHAFPDINALGVGASELLSSSETPAGSRLSSFGGPSILYFSAGMFNMIVKNK